MNLVFEIFLWTVFIILFLNISYVSVFTAAGLFYQKREYPVSNQKFRFAVFIPAYKGDEVILHTAQETLKQDYPKDFFDVIVIGDSLEELTLKTLEAMPLILVKVSFENSTKAKALLAGIKAVEKRSYDYAVILDIDNIIEEGYLEKLNTALQQNQPVIQTHRLAKNEDTYFSILDGISEEINNHVFRKGHKVFGLSAALIGSGKALRYPLFLEVMNNITAVGGFDKQMEILLIAAGHKIDYADEIWVYDEKVQKPEIFSNQRKRWMSAQVTFMEKYAFKGLWTSLRTLETDYFDKSLQLILLPRIITLGLAIVFSLDWFAHDFLGDAFAMLMVTQILVLFLATPRRYYNARTAIALLYLPYGFILMFLNFFKLKGANQKFIHTPHAVSDQKKNRT